MSGSNHNHIEDMVEIILPKSDSFLIIKETLTRIGILNKEKTRLFQTCHILCKHKRLFIVHFKEMFILDGKPTSFTPSDLARRNSIINYLVERKFFALASGAERVDPALPREQDFDIIHYKDRTKVELVPKYVIGAAKNKPKVKTAS